MKKLTVMGIMGKTQGVNIVAIPLPKAMRNITSNECFFPSPLSAVFAVMVSVVCAVILAVSVGADFAVSMAAVSAAVTASPAFTLKVNGTSSGAMQLRSLQS